jgi:PncC family amidohydrolase
LIAKRYEEQLFEILTRERLTIATAESCTGGLVSHLITAISGSSAYFLGGIVAYSNDVKMSLLGVPQDVLERVGAVSAECALAMAQGARARIGADIGISTTGIAGPGGATPTKPVGLVYIACSTPWGDHWDEHQFQGNRIETIRASAEAALASVLAQLARRDNATDR